MISVTLTENFSVFHLVKSMNMGINVVDVTLIARHALIPPSILVSHAMKSLISFSSMTLIARKCAVMA